MNAQCGWATFSLCGRHTFFDLFLKAIRAQRSRQRAHVHTDSLMICHQRRKIRRGLHGIAQVISCSIGPLSSFHGSSNSLLGFFRQLCFGSKRGKLSYGIIVRRAIKAYEEFCIRVLCCNLMATATAADTKSSPSDLRFLEFEVRLRISKVGGARGSIRSRIPKAAGTILSSA